MTAISESASVIHDASSIEGKSGDYAPGSRRFDLAVAGLSFWVLAGAFLDGFAHHNLGTLETFFTPWHGVLYSGVLATAGFLIFTLIKNVRRGYLPARALPQGYWVSLLGAGLFALSGLADLVWHTLFGIEAGVEALLSPTHLMLAAGGLLIAIGALSAVWRRAEVKQGWANVFPALMAMLVILSTLTFFTEYVNSPYLPNIVVQRSGDASSRLVQGLAGVFIPTALMMGVVLLGIRRWTMPVGSMTFLLTGNAVLMSWFHVKEMALYPQVLPVVLLIGPAVDGLLWLLKPSAERTRALRVFAFAVPFLLFSGFFGVLAGTAGLCWTVHLWTGAIVIAGVIGLLMSYLVVPPEVVA